MARLRRSDRDGQSQKSRLKQTIHSGVRSHIRSALHAVHSHAARMGFDRGRHQRMALRSAPRLVQLDLRGSDRRIHPPTPQMARVALGDTAAARTETAASIFAASIPIASSSLEVTPVKLSDLSPTCTCLYAQARASDLSTLSAPSLLTETRTGLAASVLGRSQVHAHPKRVD